MAEFIKQKYKIAVVIIVVVLFAMVVTGETGIAGTTQEDCPAGEVLRQYKCPSNPWEECDPYMLHAQADELFCKMIVYTDRPGSSPYIRTVPSQLCYPDPPWDGYVCMAFYPDFAAVWTEGDTYGIHSIYVNSVRRNVQFVPLISKR